MWTISYQCKVSKIEYHSNHQHAGVILIYYYWTRSVRQWSLCISKGVSNFFSFGSNFLYIAEILRGRQDGSTFQKHCKYWLRSLKICYWAYSGWIYKSLIVHHFGNQFHIWYNPSHRKNPSCIKIPQSILNARQACSTKWDVYKDCQA